MAPSSAEACLRSWRSPRIREVVRGTATPVSGTHTALRRPRRAFLDAQRPSLTPRPRSRQGVPWCPGKGGTGEGGGHAPATPTPAGAGGARGWGSCLHCQTAATAPPHRARPAERVVSVRSFGSARLGASRAGGRHGRVEWGKWGKGRRAEDATPREGTTGCSRSFSARTLSEKVRRGGARPAHRPRRRGWEGEGGGMCIADGNRRRRRSVAPPAWPQGPQPPGAGAGRGEVAGRPSLGTRLRGSPQFALPAAWRGRHRFLTGPGRAAILRAARGPLKGRRAATAATPFRSR